MNYQAHQIGGICASAMVATSVFYGSTNHTVAYIAMGLTIVGGAIGGLIPDIDHPSSKVGRKVPLLSKVVNSVFGHRGFTHTLLAALIFTYLLFLLVVLFPDGLRGYLLPFFMGLSVGYLSHLLLDMLTVQGIPLLFPFTSKNIRVARLRSGRDDLLVIILMIGFTGGYLYFSGVL